MKTNNKATTFVVVALMIFAAFVAGFIAFSDDIAVADNSNVSFGASNTTFPVYLAANPEAGPVTIDGMAIYGVEQLEDEGKADYIVSSGLIITSKDMVSGPIARLVLTERSMTASIASDMTITNVDISLGSTLTVASEKTLTIDGTYTSTLSRSGNSCLTS